MNYDQLFLQHVAASYDKQMALGDLIGSNPWQFDMNTASLSFGDSLRFRIEILGTESSYSNTWLWGWANESSGIPAEMLAASEEMRALGRQEGIHEFLHPDWQLSERLNGHILSMIASGLCDCNAYYRGPYEGGALFMLIRDPAFPQARFNPLQRIVTLFPQLISTIPIADHQTAFRHYLAYYGAEVHEHGQLVIGHFAKGDEIEASFLADRRLEKLETRLSH